MTPQPQNVRQSMSESHMTDFGQEMGKVGIWPKIFWLLWPCKKGQGCPFPSQAWQILGNYNRDITCIHMVHLKISLSNVGIWPKTFWPLWPWKIGQGHMFLNSFERRIRSTNPAKMAVPRWFSKNLEPLGVNRPLTLTQGHAHTFRDKLPKLRWHHDNTAKTKCQQLCADIMISYESYRCWPQLGSLWLMLPIMILTS